MGIDYTKTLTQKTSAQTPAPTVNIPDELQKRYGQGLSQTFTRNELGFNTKVGVNKVLQNIMVCLTTPVGRRMDQPDFGSMLYYLLHEAKTRDLKDELEQATEEALKAFIPQIIVERVDVDYTYKNVVVIILQFLFKGTTKKEVVDIRLTMNDAQVFSASIFSYNGNRFFG